MIEWSYAFKDGVKLNSLAPFTTDEIKDLCRFHGEVTIDFKEIDPSKYCNMCDSNRDDWEYATDTYDAGTFGKYELSMAVSNRGITVEFCKENGSDLLYSIFSKGIKYCPYCGRKLNIKEDK